MYRIKIMIKKNDQSKKNAAFLYLLKMDDKKDSAPVKSVSTLRTNKTTCGTRHLNFFLI
jgi:hypothetical protein